MPRRQGSPEAQSSVIQVKEESDHEAGVLGRVKQTSQFTLT